VDPGIDQTLGTGFVVRQRPWVIPGTPVTGEEKVDPRIDQASGTGFVVRQRPWVIPGIPVAGKRKWTQESTKLQELALWLDKGHGLFLEYL